MGTTTLQQETPEAVPAWYILSEDFLSDLPDFHNALDTISDFLETEPWCIKDALVRVVKKTEITKMRLVELLEDHNIREADYRYYIKDKPTTSSQIKLSDDGEIMISEDLILEYLDFSEISPVSPLVIGGILEKYDPDSGVKNLICLAFAGTLLFPDGYWEEREEEISGFPDSVKNDILAARDMMQPGQDYPLFKTIRKIVLQHLEII